MKSFQEMDADERKAYMEAHPITKDEALKWLKIQHEVLSLRELATRHFELCCLVVGPQSQYRNMWEWLDALRRVL